MPKRIAILGASGSVGGALAVHILRAQLLEAADQLLLVGRGELATERKLLNMRADLMDAFDDARVGVEVVPEMTDVEADIVIVAAGITSSSPGQTRRDLGAANRAIFEGIAEQVVTRLPQALFIVVSNPVELAVKILSSSGHRRLVIGMGAQQDSLRFARAIATDLGISRHDVRATVMGEHGGAMLPLWGSVELLTDDRRATDCLADLRARITEAPLQTRVTALQSKVKRLLRQDRTAEAYRVTQRALPDARIFVEPLITFNGLHSTPHSTANATLQCITAALANDHRRVHGQVDLRGEVLGLSGVCGIPLSIGKSGWRAESLDWLQPDDIRAVKRSVESIEAFVSETLIATVRPAPSREDLFTTDGLDSARFPAVDQAGPDYCAKQLRHLI
jgi:malate dehydrogenase